MAMGEVAYELRDDVDILVAAEGLEPAFGWPYDRILQAAESEGRRPVVRTCRQENWRSISSTSTSMLLGLRPERGDCSRSGGDRPLEAEDRGHASEGVVPAFKALVHSLKGVLATDNTTARTLPRGPTTSSPARPLVRADVQGGSVRGSEGSVRAAQDLLPDRALTCTQGRDVDPALEECVIRSGCSGFAHSVLVRLARSTSRGACFAGLSESGFRERDRLVRLRPEVPDAHSASSSVQGRAVNLLIPAMRAGMRLDTVRQQRRARSTPSRRCKNIKARPHQSSWPQSGERKGRRSKRLREGSVLTAKRSSVLTAKQAASPPSRSASSCVRWSL